jgi:SOS response regulatory protein OraA/RecX
LKQQGLINDRAFAEEYKEEKEKQLMAGIGSFRIEIQAWHPR